MEHVDYQKLAEQYATFLVAVGGVSITVLAIVLNLRPDSAGTPKPAEGDTRSYLVTALVVAALSCFIGAQMMAETAAFTNYTEPVKSTTVTEQITSTTVTEQVKSTTVTEQVKIAKNAEPPTLTNPTKKADRLFLLASANIFVAIVLVFFALILLPLSSGKVHRDSMKPIAWLFILMVAGATYWAILAGKYRMRVDGRECAACGSLLIGLVWGVLFYCLAKEGKWLLRARPEKKLPERPVEAEVASAMGEVASECTDITTIPKKKWRWTNVPRLERKVLFLAFAPSTLLTVISLAWFTWIYKDGTQATLEKATIYEGWFFSLSIAVSYASLVVASIQTMFGEQTKTEPSIEAKPQEPGS